MNNGVLQFSLGLTTAGFLSSVASARGAVAGFVTLATGAAATGLAFFTAGVEKAIGRGSALEAMSKRTGTNVAALYQLQRGFENVGLSADDAGPMLFKLQKALGGVNEFGQETRSVFFKMGLDIGALKHMDAQAQFTLIAAALARMNQSAGASAAGMIFGREGAQQMVQLAASTKDFATAIQRSAKDAAAWERVSDSFEKFEIKMRALKEEAGVFFADIAGKLMPLFDKAGAFAMALRNAFEGGHLAEMLALSIRTGLDTAIPYVEAFVKSFGVMFLDVMKAVAAAAGELIGASLINRIVNGAKMAEAQGAFNNALGLYNEETARAEKAKKEGDTATFNDAVKRAGDMRARMDAATNYMAGVEKDFTDTQGQIVKDALSKMAGINPLQDFANTWNPQQDNSPAAVLDRLRMKRLLDLGAGDWANFVGGQSGGAAGAGEDKDMLMKGQYKPEFTSLEKMGFVMNGGGRHGTEQRKLTLMESLLANTNKLIERLTPNPNLGVSPLINQI
ncbi:MAG: hypothetical protein ABSE16_08440 [Verrucomicrobiota bacterium]|jgi:hypothetical protein